MRDTMYFELKQFARFRKNAIAYNDPVDVFHMMTCIMLCQQKLESIYRMREITIQQYDRYFDLIMHMRDQAFEVSVQIRSNIWDLLRDKNYIEGGEE